MLADEVTHSFPLILPTSPNGIRQENERRQDLIFINLTTRPHLHSESV